MVSYSDFLNILQDSFKAQNSTLSLTLIQLLAQPLLLFFGLTFLVILIYTFLTINMVLSTSALKSNANHL